MQRAEGLRLKRRLFVSYPQNLLDASTVKLAVGAAERAADKGVYVRRSLTPQRKNLF